MAPIEVSDDAAPPTSLSAKWHTVAVAGALALVLVAALAASNLGLGFMGVHLGDSGTEARAAVVEGTDAFYYLSAGDDLLENGELAPDRRWMLNHWPPGMPVLFAGLLAVSQLGVPFVALVAMLAVAAWVGVLVAWYRLGARTGSLIGATIAVFAIALGAPMREWYLGGGLLFSEPPAVIAFLAFLYLLLRAELATGRASYAIAAAAGGSLAAAAYFRTLFELTATMLSVIAVGAMSVAALMLVGRGARTAELGRRLAQTFVLLLVAVVSYQALTVPWRIIASNTVRPGDTRWSLTDNSFWANNWLPDSVMTERGLGWLEEGEGNTACQVDERRCADFFLVEVGEPNPYSGEATSHSEFKSAALQALADHPVEWTIIKLRAFPQFWFGTMRDLDNYEFLLNGTLLAILLASLTAGWRRSPMMYQLALCVCLLATLGPMFLAHYEERYLLPVKTLIPLSLIWLLPVRRPAGWRRTTETPPSSWSPSESGTDVDDGKARKAEVSAVVHRGIQS